ncbi:MAG: A/G-specific adenine glycosylase [Clostridiales bacterium]|nr:A/G-specific adenine glycosylase [Clostridiales bacterium]MDD7309115.1 A/G-specific adenine glycosylase [Eubacteriales bacterium]MDY5347829.1 A/G-specific adenine glycosylase [Eubacteriales bacterium]
MNETAQCLTAVLSFWRTEGEPLLAKLSQTLPDWFEGHARDLPWRADREPYHVWLSEIMLQQTRAETVKPYYERFLQTFPTVAALADAVEPQVFKLWEGLGYYSRARNLLQTAKLIQSNYAGHFPTSYAELLKLPGIGAYTAGAIASICYGQPVAAVDGNVLRVVSRITELYLPIDEPLVRQGVAESLSRVYPLGRCGAFTQSLMELGATVCVPNGAPKCEQCPANSFCRAYAEQSADLLPVRRPKKTREIEEKTVLILKHAGRLAVRRRQDSGLLAGLWELPNVGGFASPEEMLQLADEWHAAPTCISAPFERKHIFTHIEWHMRCYELTCAEMPDDFIWATEEMLRQEITLPTAFRVCLEPQKRNQTKAKGEN